MPHSVDEEREREEAEDQALINKLISGEDIGGLDNLNEQSLDVGDKADDAEDFGDIADDDLAEDEDAIPVKTEVEDDDLDGLFGGAGGAEEDDDFDDLFNSRDQPNLDDQTEPVTENQKVTNPPPATQDHGRTTRSVSEDSLTAEEVPADPNEVAVQSESEEEDDETREQRLLFEQHALRYRQDLHHDRDGLSEPPPPPQTDAELFAMIWPQFKPDEPPRFGELLPPKKAYYVGKKPLKPPKPVAPNKVSLELHADQEKSFRLAGSAYTNPVTRRADAEARGLVLVEDNQPKGLESEEEDAFDLSDEEADIGNIKWHDLVALCQDWDIPSGDGASLDVSEDEESAGVNGDNLFYDADLNNDRPTKRRKIGTSRNDLLEVLHTINYSLDDPEKATARIAKRIFLDMNDQNLLLDQQSNDIVQPKKRATSTKLKRDAVGGLTKDLSKRYNISNDEAYDLLKENHQNKIRSTLGNVAIEHSLPAIKLQYPFYKVKLTPREARSFHRPMLNVQHNITIDFEKTRVLKKKVQRVKPPQEAFEKAHDLSLSDNSHMLLLEYSEEYPSMLSSFGMGSKLINYYRRKDNEDTARPKQDLGETQVLLPQDKSPFSIFGDVDRGQTMPTIHNNMYRAPIFRHESNPNDFLLIKNTTGVDGAKWYLREVENLHVVGQEFPSVEVPGTHSRKVTDAAKKRLRMLSYRIYKKNWMLDKYAPLKNEMILKHLPGSDIAQNRSKMREFMDYDKDRGWMPRGDIAPLDEIEIRSWLKPEDICLLESMQVGDRQLQDAGYNKDEEDSGEEDENDKVGSSIDHQLAPWNTTKNFLNACQGKAMLQLHGEGDPSGRGEAFNLIRTSMKGGFREIGESVEDRLDAKRLKEFGGHSYNVARQQKAYNEAIRRIWDAQTRSLLSTVVHEDVDMEDVVDDQGTTPRGIRGPTPSTIFDRVRRDDESASIMSHGSNVSQTGKVLRITREYRDKYGKLESRQEIIQDPRVIREYVRRRRQIDLNETSLAEMKPTGDPEIDRMRRAKVEEELARLEKNKERRQIREKAKHAANVAASPDAVGSPGIDVNSFVGGTGSRGGRKAGATGTTQRKCANCGQVGHIKTNKKSVSYDCDDDDDGNGDACFHQRFICDTCVFMTTPVKDLRKNETTAPCTTPALPVFDSHSRMIISLPNPKRCGSMATQSPPRAAISSPRRLRQARSSTAPYVSSPLRTSTLAKSNKESNSKTSSPTRDSTLQKKRKTR